MSGRRRFTEKNSPTKHVNNITCPIISVCRQRRYVKFESPDGDGDRSTSKKEIPCIVVAKRLNDSEQGMVAVKMRY
jgi:hypothetical protein